MGARFIERASYILLSAALLLAAGGPGCSPAAAQTRASAAGGRANWAPPFAPASPSLLTGIKRFIPDAADADVFFCLSRHEGFCIPLLEAMRAGTPIVALDAGAVGETLADAGILLPTARPATVAAAVDRVRRDHDLADSLVASGRRRLGDFAETVTRQRFVDVLSQVAARGMVVA